MNSTTLPKTTTTIVLAAFNPDERAAMYLPRHAYDKVRTPDFVEPDGTSVWLSEHGVVTVPAERLRAFHTYMRVRGLTRPAKGTWKMHDGEESWDNLRSIVER